MKSTTIGKRKLNKTVMFHTKYRGKGNRKLAALPDTKKKKQKRCGKNGNVFPEPNAVPQIFRGLKVSTCVTDDLQN